MYKPRIHPALKPSSLAAFSRRQFLKLSAATLGMAALARFRFAPQHHSQAYQAASLPNGVAAGDTTQSSTMLWAHSTAPGTVTFEVAESDTFSTVFATLSAEVSDPTIPVKVEVTGLWAGTTYWYRATDAAGGEVVGHFRTPAALGSFTGLRFGVSGDWRGELAPYPSIKNAAARDLAFFVAMGDTIYADYPSPALESGPAVTLDEYRLKHNEGYSARFDVNHWAVLRGSTSFIPTIDDHEVMNDFAGGAAPSTDARFASYSGAFVNETEIYRNAMQAFTEYNPIHAETWLDEGDPRMANKLRLYRNFNYGSDAAVFVLDCRSFRDAPIAPIEDLSNQASILKFLQDAFNNERTILGRAQFERLTSDLRRAQEDGIMWKFVMVPEPIQNLGVVVAEDRFEGFAAERTALLKFIASNEIKNVVFVSADIHGTIVNDLAYQLEPMGEPLPTGAFDISTGSVAFQEPFGPTVVRLAHNAGVLNDTIYNAYQAASPEQKEGIIQGLVNIQAAFLRYPQIGLENESGVTATLLTGQWSATSTFGWTEFEIDASTQQLHVTTYGIEPYSRADIEADPTAILNRTPQVVLEFIVEPQA